MKLPDTHRKRALIVIDLQPAMLKPHNDHIVPRIASLIERVPYDGYVEAVWHSGDGSLWGEMMNVDHPKDETTHTVDIVHKLLAPHHPLQVTKTSRSVFMGNQDVAKYLRDLDIEEVHLVGTETNDCVFATAMSAFDLSFRPYVLEECCEALYEGRHTQGVQLLRYQKLTNNSCLAETIESELEFKL
ncbi:MAG TPA: isochorismatase family cysteine hydrolase [Candidatus Saccharimonadales bacterium]|nr:isochorismatase family cysteine hydrolase [Candidatus Saccharimonadales bacterium]